MSKAAAATGKATSAKKEVQFNKSEKTKDVRSDNINAAKGLHDIICLS